MCKMVTFALLVFDHFVYSIIMIQQTLFTWHLNSFTSKWTCQTCNFISSTLVKDHPLFRIRLNVEESACFISCDAPCEFPLSIWRARRFSRKLVSTIQTDTVSGYGMASVPHKDNIHKHISLISGENFTCDFSNQ